MNRKQLGLIVLGGALVILVLAFPPYIARHVDPDFRIDGRAVDLDRHLGRSWIGSPPGRVTPEDMDIVWDESVSPEDRKRVRAREAAKYLVPAIHWRPQLFPILVILALTQLGVRWLGRTRTTTPLEP